jgi:hypothetical protein
VNAIESGEQAKAARWKSSDPRLLRAAKRLIRLYDLRQTNLFKVNPESVAEVIAQELNRDLDERNK